MDGLHKAIAASNSKMFHRERLWKRLRGASCTGINTKKTSTLKQHMLFLIRKVGTTTWENEKQSRFTSHAKSPRCNHRNTTTPRRTRFKEQCYTGTRRYIRVREDCRSSTDILDWTDTHRRARADPPKLAVRRGYAAPPSLTVLAVRQIVQNATRKRTSGFLCTAEYHLVAHDSLVFC